MFEEPSNFTELLRIHEFGIFRSMLARLGHVLIDEPFFGAGFFDLAFEGEPASLENRFAVAFSNDKRTGHWIKLLTTSRYRLNPALSE